MVSLVRLLKVLFTLSLALGLTACFEKLPMTTFHVVTEWGHDINRVYLITTIITTIVFFAVAVPFCYALWRFRDKPGDTRIPVQVKGNHKLEILWTLIPVVLLIFIFLPTLEIIMKRHAEPDPGALTIEVIGHQWWWEFRYPDLGVVTANEMYVPENTPIVVKLKSADVIHAFWIPRWGGKMDVLPGVTNVLTYTTPTLENPQGDYYQGHCTELCGLSHARMRYEAVVLPKARFDSWVKTAMNPPLIATALEKKGQDLFMSKTCFTCHSIAGTNAVGMIGPNLTNLGNRRTIAAGTLPNSKDGLHQWLRDSIDSKADYQTVKPGSLMVFAENFVLTDDDIKALTAYLQHSTAKTF